MECDVAKDENSREDTDFYKLDKEGNVLDILHFIYDRHYPHFINEFIVFMDEKSAFYSTWPADGNKARVKMEVLNKDLTWDQHTVFLKIEDIKINSKYYFVEFDNSLNISQYIFYKDEKWQLILQQMPGYSQYSNSEKVYRYRKDIFRTGDTDSYIKENIKFLYFYPEEKMTYYHNIGGGGGSSVAENWRGKGFFQTNIGDKIFKYFIPKLVVENEQFDGNKNRFYTVPQNKYAATHIGSTFYLPNVNSKFAFYTSEAKKLYIIRNKN